MKCLSSKIFKNGTLKVLVKEQYHICVNGLSYNGLTNQTKDWASPKSVLSTQPFLSWVINHRLG